jgi:hypothetical protein
VITCQALCVDRRLVDLRPSRYPTADCFCTVIRFKSRRQITRKTLERTATGRAILSGS